MMFINCMKITQMKKKSVLECNVKLISLTLYFNVKEVHLRRSDKACYKFVFRIIEQVCGRINLLNNSKLHNHYSCIESQGNCYDISDEWNPCCQGEPYTPLVDLLLLLPERFRLDLEPPFDPLPSAYPSYPICKHTSQPIAQGPYDEAFHRISCYSEYAQIQRVRTERKDSCRQKCADEKSP